MTPDQLQRLERLENLIDGLLNAGQIDPDMATTLGLLLTSASGKAASAENQAVDEAGSATYNVLKPPDKFIKIGDTHVAGWNS